MNSSIILDNVSMNGYGELGSNVSSCTTIPYEISVAGTLFGIIIVIAGIFGNLLVILSVLAVKSLRKMSNIFVVSLACWDLYQNILVKPFYIHTYIRRQWDFGPTVCVYVLFASNLAILESILHVSAIAFHRYVILVHSTCTQRCHSERSLLIVLILAIYLLPIIVTILPSIEKLSKPLHMGQEVVFNNRIMFCSFVRHSEFRLGGVLKKVLFIMTVAVFLFYCYVRIYIVVRKSGQVVNSSSGVMSPTRLRREWTLLKTILVIFVTFIFSYLPISALYGADTERNFPYWLYFIGVLALWCASSVNWLIYGLMNKQYFRAYKYVLCCASTFPGLVVGSVRGRERSSVSKSSFSMSVRNGHQSSMGYHACSPISCRALSDDMEGERQV